MFGASGKDEHTQNGVCALGLAETQMLVRKPKKFKFG